MWSTPAPAAAAAAAPAASYYPSSTSQMNGAAPAAAPASSSAAAASSLSFVSADSNARSKAARKKMQKQTPGAWVCALCTFNNKAAAREKCEMCEEPNPRAFDPPAPAVPVVAPAAAAKAPSGAAAPAPLANGGGKKGSAAAAVAAAAAAASAAPSVPAPAPATVVPSNVSASFRALSYENGLVTACNNLTFDEVMRRRLIGLPRPQMDLISKLKSKHSAIFLLNLETKEMWGVFEADGTGQLDLEPDAWAGQSYNGRKTSRFPAQCYFTVAADFESPLSERHYRDVIYAGGKRDKIRILSAEETRALIKVFQAKSKMRKALGVPHAVASTVAPAPLSHVSPSVAAAPPAAAASASSASSFVAAAAQHTSANTSRRNSIDSTASGEDDPKKKTSAAAAAATKKNPKANQTCKRWLADECTFTDESCKFMHVATVCRAFQRGTCPKGDRCPFVHDKVDREHYKHGRSYCQKTAVHDDLPPSKSSGASAGASSAAAPPKKFVAPQPKDSLDSILSGLGSWKQKKQPEPVAAAAAAAASAAEPEPQEEAEETGAAESAQNDHGALDDAAAAAEEAAQDAQDLLASAGASVDLLDDAAQAAEDEAQLAASANLHFDLDHSQMHGHGHAHHGGVYDQSGPGSFMDGGLGFDGASAAPSAAGGWASASPALSMEGGQHYQQAGDGSFYQSDLQSAQQFGGVGVGVGHVEEEFAWFNNFRQHIVAPALQALHAREQQAQHKIIGPD